MQKLISKYSLAAHLGLLTAAPLFLYPYLGMSAVCVTWLVGSLFVAMWALMEPSRRRGEMLHDARWRFQRSVAISPLFYTLLVFIGYAVLVHYNSGLALAYDVESEEWVINPPRYAGLCASVAGTMLPTLAAGVALLATGLSVRYALGRGARAVFLFCFSLFGGLSGIAIAGGVAISGNREIIAFLRSAIEGGSFVGCGFALAMLAGIAAIPSAFERGWAIVSVLFVPAIGGSFIGMFLCSTLMEIFVFAVAAIVLLVCAVVYSAYVVHGPGSLKCLVAFLISVTIAVAMLWSLMPVWAGAQRFEKLMALSLLPADFMQIRKAIDTAVLAAWRQAVWLGSGVGTLGWQLRFHAQPEDWLVIPPTTAAALNGWVAALVERGFIGCIAFAVPAIAIVTDWVNRAGRMVVSECVRTRGTGLFRLFDPQCWIGVIGALALGVAALFGESPLASPSLMVSALLMIFSINVFKLTENDQSTISKE